MNTLLRKKC